MKKAFKRISKSSISLALSIVMIASSVLFTSASSVDYKNDAASSSVEQSTEVELYKGEGTIELGDEVSAEDFYEGKDTLNASGSNETSESTSNEDEVSVKNDTAAVVATQKPEKVLPQVSGASTKVVYFARPTSDRNSTWANSNRNIYVYTNDNLNGSWPGVQMTVDSNTGLYKANVNDNTTGVIFSVGYYNNGKYTKDAQAPGSDFYTFENNGVYITSGNAASSGSYTIQFKKPSDWTGNVYAHYWKSTGSGGSTVWRGTKLSTITGSSDTYSITIGKAFDKIIFSTDTSGVTSQTVDLTSSEGDGKVFKTTSVSNSKYNCSAEALESAGFTHNLVYAISDKAVSNFHAATTTGSDSTGKYFEFNVSKVNCYFACSSSTDYTGMYNQGTTAPTFDITYDSTLIETKTSAELINYTNSSGTSKTYNFVWFKPKSSAVRSVRVYVLEDSSGGYGKKFQIVANTSNYAQTTGNVTILAKTGTIRGDFDKYSKLGYIVDVHYTDDPTTSLISGYAKTYGSNTEPYEKRLALAEGVQRNREIECVVRVKGTSNNWNKKYYIKAFCVNGKTYNVISEDEAADIVKNNNSEYSCKFTVSNTDVGPIEITPIYYYFENGNDSNYITFSAEDFVGDVQALWGNTLACYAYYVGGSDEADFGATTKNTLGGYPGQPMVYINGSYYMQIPKTNGAGNTIEGITLNNYVWDDIHAIKLAGNQITTSTINDASDDQKKAANAQTYDYDDFVALRDTRSPSRIIFNFKYRTYNNNDASSSDPYKGNPSDLTATGTSSANDLSFVDDANGWDALVDYYDVPVDLFARRIGNTTDRYTNHNTNGYLDTPQKSEYLNEKYVESADCDDKVYVISNGYEAYYGKTDNDNNTNKYVGQYATRWYVYTKNGDGTFKYIGALPPSAFLTGLKSPDILAQTYAQNNSAYLSSKFKAYGSAATTGADNTLSTWTDYQNIYQACAGKPVVISYESNIYSKGISETTGAGSTGTTENPGYRCDGRWYYSKPNQKITGQTKIWVIQKDADGNPVTGENGYTAYWEDEYIEGTGKGLRTGANAAFINDSIDAYGDSYKGKTSTTVYESEDGYFQFKADGSSVGTSQDGNTSNINYKFVGWYLETGSRLLNDVSEDVYGERQMDAFSTFVAVYEPIKVDSTVSAEATKTLVVDHDTYSNLYAGLTSTNGVTVPGNGSGMPYIDSVTIKSSDGNTTYYTSSKKTKGSMTISSTDFTSTPSSDAVITVVLSTVPDAGSTYTGAYISNTGKTSYVKNSNTGTGAASYTGDLTNNKVTYTYTYGSLFGSANFAKLQHYSDFTSTVIPIQFKYYDRKSFDTSAPETISEEASTITIKQTVSDGNVEAAIRTAFGADPSNSGGTNTAVNRIDNVLDSYYFWFTQSDAKSNIALMTNYRDYKGHVNGKFAITNYGVYGDTYNAANGNDSVLENHFDCYGMPYLESYTGGYTRPTGFTAEKWVTYTKKDGTVVEYDGETLTSAQVSEIAYVTVWGYNVPKTYNVILNSPEDNATAADLTQSFSNGTTTVYYCPTDDCKVANINAFYNQRLGGEDTSNADANLASDYLGKYGFSTFFGTNSEITANEEYTTVTEVEGVETTTRRLVFDGWYDTTTHAKISSDRSYGFRVTRNMNMIACYKQATVGEEVTVTRNVHVNVENNGVQHFVDANNVDRVRLMTVLNVYGNLDTRKKITVDGEEIDNPEYGNALNKDENIKNVAAIYVQLPVKDTSGNKINWNSTNLALLGLDSREEGTLGKEVYDYIHSESFLQNAAVADYGKVSVIVNTLSINTNSNIISYTYSVTFNSNEVDSSTTLLTNKNRLTFTLPMRADYYEGTGETPGANSAIISYIAICYKDGDADAQWILSDNHAEFIADVSK